MENNFWDIAFSDLLIAGEKISGKGEDAYLNFASENGGIFGVFDGCGGLGARQYTELGGWTGAYTASRAVAYGLFDWFQDACLAENWWEQAAEQAGRSAADALGRCKGLVRTKSMLMGGMQKEFPTTAVIGLLYWLSEKRQMGADFLWAGDSRGYVLDRSGLCQITRDDAEGQNAMSEIYSDGALTNVMSASAPFTLHERHLTLSAPAIVFAATDGCFGYLGSPMEFEYCLLDTMMRAQTVEQWEKALGEVFDGTAGDDYTLSGQLLGFRDFSACRQYYKGRYQYLQMEFMLPLRNGGREERYRLWELYRPGYEKYITESRQP